MHLRTLVVLASVVLTSAPTYAAEAAERSPFEKRYALQTVSRFPTSTLVVRPSTRDAFYALGSYRLGPGSRQGGPSWFVGHLHFRITLSRLQGDARVYVSADTNERTFAQIEFEARDERIRWSTYDLFRGATQGLSRHRTAEISFFNYLQNRGVRPGRNSIRLHVEQFGNARVDELIVLPDSAIHTTRRSPHPLSLEVKPLDGQAQVGESFRVRFTLAPKRGYDQLEDVGIRAVYNHSELRLQRPLPEATFPRLRRKVHGVFLFQALDAGSHDIEFQASSDINNPSVGLRVQVAPRSERWFESGSGHFGAALLAMGLVLAAVGMAARRRRES